MTMACFVAFEVCTLVVCICPMVDLVELGNLFPQAPFSLLFWARAGHTRSMCGIWEAGVRQKPLHSEVLFTVTYSKERCRGAPGGRAGLALLHFMVRCYSRLLTDQQRLRSCLMLHMDSQRWSYPAFIAPQNFQQGIPSQWDMLGLVGFPLRSKLSPTPVPLVGWQGLSL